VPATALDALRAAVAAGTRIASICVGAFTLAATGLLGYHPLFCFLDGTREALSGMLREGRAGSNTTAGHITVLDQALQQNPDAHRYGTPILIRCSLGVDWSEVDRSPVFSQLSGHFFKR
jgi:putative intracellular protease/amidase